MFSVLSDFDGIISKFGWKPQLSERIPLFMKGTKGGFRMMKFIFLAVNSSFISNLIGSRTTGKKAW